MEEQDKRFKTRALFHYQTGPETQEIVETLTNTREDYKIALEKLDAYFSPKKNVDYEIFLASGTTARWNGRSVCHEREK